MNKYLKHALDFLFYAVITVIFSFIIINILQSQNPWYGLYLLFTPYAAALSGLIGILIGLKWNLKWINKFFVSLIILVPCYALVMLILT